MTTANFVPQGMRLPANVVEARKQADQDRREQSLADVTAEIRKERVRREYSLHGVFGRRVKRPKSV